MKGPFGRGTARAAAAALLATVLVPSCESPTQITLAITTDARCGDVHGTTISVGTLGAFETMPPRATTSRCQPDGYLGTIVVVPSGGKSADVAIKVVTGFGKGADAEACRPPGYGKGCIVARRALHFVPHEPLVLPIAMRAICAGVVCGTDETCTADGQCEPATIAEPALCEPPTGCAEPGGQGNAPMCDQTATGLGCPCNPSTKEGCDCDPDARAMGCCQKPTSAPQGIANYCVGCGVSATVRAIRCNGTGEFHNVSADPMYPTDFSTLHNDEGCNCEGPGPQWVRCAPPSGGPGAVTSCNALCASIGLACRDSCNAPPATCCENASTGPSVVACGGASTTAATGLGLYEQEMNSTCTSAGTCADPFSRPSAAGTSVSCSNAFNSSCCCQAM